MEIDKIYQGDSLDVLKTFEDNSVDCCVTSPPYYALRDYGVDGQIGLEETPEKYIERLTEVFMEVYRVLKPNGTLWLNIGDSYNGSGGNHKEGQKNDTGFQGTLGVRCGGKGARVNGLKPKDLIGIPWALATSLRNPFYKGKIKKESDRRWLSAIIDGEGCITGTLHTRKDGSGERTSIFINVTNSNIDLLNECERIYPFGKRLIHQKNGKEHLGEKEIFRWNIFGCKAMKDLLQELYPYLIAKKTQCLLAYNFCLIQETSKKDGHTPKREEVNKKRKLLISLISLLNKGEKIEIPDWCIEPPTLYTQGWYLRQDIIWHKPNPMPESVKDRCTKSHEYIFLLSKGQKYYFDYEAIQEEATSYDGRKDTMMKGSKKYDAQIMPNQRVQSMAKNGHERWKFKSKNCQYDGQRPNSMRLNRETGLVDEVYPVRNKRDVWTINPKPNKEAHFATYPPELVSNCIIAGCPEGGIVLDPFMGSGTTGIVANKLNRHYVGIELNPEYVEMAERRIGLEKSQLKLF